MGFLLVFAGYLSLLILSYLFSYFIGSSLLVSAKHLEEKPYQKIFFSVFTGQLAITAGFAIIYTKGHTVFSSYLFMYLFYLIYTKKYTHFSKLKNLIDKPALPWTKIFLVCIIFLFAFSWSFYISMNPNAYGFVNVPNFNIGEYQDYFQYYTNVGYFMQEAGVENMYRVNNLLNSDFNVNVPYHYYDHWINNAFSTIFCGNYLKTQYLISRPLMLSTSILGILAIAEYYSKVKLKHMFYAISFAFVGPIGLNTLIEHFSYLEFINPFFDFMLQINPHKNAYYYAFVIAGILFLKREQWLYSSMIFSALGIASIAAFPAVTSICFALPLILLLLKKIKTRAALIMYSQIIGSALLLYFSLTKVDPETFGSYPLFDLLQESVKDKSLTDFIIMNIKADIHKTSYYFLLYIIPILIVLLTKRKTIKDQLKNNLIIICLICIFFVSGLVTWNLTYFIHDSYQFFIHPTSVIFNSIFFFVLLDFLNNSKYRIMSHLVLLFCISSNLLLAIKRINADKANMNPYSIEYLKSIEEITNKTKELKIIASIRESVSFNERYFQGALIYLYGHQLTQFQNNFGFVGIDDLSMKLEYKNNYKNKMVTNNLKVSAFYHFVEQERKKGNHLSEEEYQVSFLKKHHINYLIFNKEVMVAEGVKNLIEKRIEDKKSGEVFCVLNTR